MSFARNEIASEMSGKPLRSASQFIKKNKLIVIKYCIPFGVQFLPPGFLDKSSDYMVIAFSIFSKMKKQILCMRWNINCCWMHHYWPEIKYGCYIIYNLHKNTRNGCSSVLKLRSTQVALSCYWVLPHQAELYLGFSIVCLKAIRLVQQQTALAHFCRRRFPADFAYRQRNILLCKIQ